MKIVLIGSSGVGKTCLVNRYINNSYSDFSDSTIGASFSSKRLTYTVNNKNIEYKMEIWDTAGQERYISLLPLYYRNSDIIILVYDVTNRKTFESIQNIWLPEIYKHLDINTVDVYLVGSKIDLLENQKSKINNCIQLEEKQLHSYFISSKKDIGIDKLFSDIIKNYYDKKEILKNNSSNTIDIKLNDNNYTKYFYCF